MGLGKTYSTKYLADSNNNTGAAGQVLISTSNGINWSDGTDIIGGPYLPLAGGTMTASANINMNSGTLSSVDSIDFGIGQLNGVSTSNLILKSLGDITYNVDSNNNGNSSHIFQESGSELMRIRYDGNVGIGTTSPERALHIDANGARPIIQIDKGGDKIFSVGTGTSANDDDNTILQLFDEGTEKIRLFTVGDSFFNGGNVGIGTNTPSEKLDVVGNIRLGNNPNLLWGSNTLTLKTATSSTIGVFSLAPNSNGTVYDPRFQMLNASQVVGVSIRTDANSYFNGGNVGIGTTSPMAKLVVSDAGGTGLEITPQDANTRISLLAYDRLDSAYRELNFDGYNYTFRTSGNVKAVMLNSGNVGIGTTNPLAALQVNSITASTMSQVAGEVHIIGVNHDLSDTQMGTLNLTSTSRDAGTSNQALGSSLTFSQNASKYVDGYEVVIGGIKTELMYTGNMNKSSIMNFYTHTNSGLTPKMSIDATGNVGIGTTNPGGIFEVFQQSTGRTRGDLLVDVGAKYVYVGRLSTTSGDVSSFKVRDRLNRAYFDVNTASKYISFNPEVGDITMQIASGYGFKVNGGQFNVNATNGNVGIGTTNPVSGLQISTSTTGDANRNTTTAGITLTRYISGTDYRGSSIFHAYQGISGSDKELLAFAVGPGNSNSPFDFAKTKMVITEAGSVGIGTTTPNAKLDIQGTQGQLFSVTDDLSGDIFSVADISGVPIMNVNSDGTSYFDGRLGSWIG